MKQDTQKQTAVVATSTAAGVLHAIQSAMNALVSGGKEVFSLTHSRTREAWEQATGYGFNAFNSYTARKAGINVTLFALALEWFAEIREWLLCAEGKAAFYLMSGESGTQGGVCEMFAFPLGDKTLNVLQHPAGKWVFEGAFKGLRLLTESEVISRIAIGHSLARFCVESRETKVVTKYSGAVIGDMRLKRQALVYRQKDGSLGIKCLTTGPIGESELADKAWQDGALSAAEISELKGELLSGVVVSRRKTDAKNTVRKSRKALPKS